MRLRGTTGILLLPVILVAAAGCESLTESTSTLIVGTGDPVVELDPSEFLKTCAPDPGGACFEVPVQCAALPGAMQSYVVTFVDQGPLTDAGAGFPLTLPSSPPTPCSQRVGFTNGIAGHRYMAHVDGYEQAAKDIVPACSVKAAYGTCADGTSVAPLGNGTCTSNSDCYANGCYGRCTSTAKQVFDKTVGVCVTDNTNPGMVNVCDYQQAPGERHMVEPGKWTPVTPRWSTPSGSPCGYQNLVTVSAYERIAISPCEPLEDRGSSAGAVTGIVVKPASTLGPYGCYEGTGSTAVGTVTKFDVDPDETSGIAPKKGIDCKTAGDVTFTQGVAAGQEVYFRVLAYDPAHLTPTLRATCVATAGEGIVVTAKCVPLTPIVP